MLADAFFQLGGVAAFEAPSGRGRDEDPEELAAASGAMAPLASSTQHGAGADAGRDALRRKKTVLAR